MGERNSEVTMELPGRDIRIFWLTINVLNKSVVDDGALVGY